MKQKLIAKAAAALLCAGALLLVNFLLFRLYVGAKLDLRETYIASRDISPRTKISESDLVPVRISGRYLADHAFTRKEDIIGKYTEIQGMIPAGSPFYKSMLYEESELPAHASGQLKEDQVSFSIEVDVAMLGGIEAGQRADVFVTVSPRSEAPVTGCLLRNVRVIDVKDHKGISLRSAESTKVPYLAELAVSGSHLELLTMAKTYGTFQLYMSVDSYDTDREAVLDENSQITSYLRALMNPQQESSDGE